VFVTSDTFDLKRIGHFRDFEWRENLVCGVVVLGTEWRGYQADAQYMLEAAKCSGLIDEIVDAGYSREGDRRMHILAPKSFERLAEGKLAGAKNAHGLFFRGYHDAPGSEAGTMVIGGETSGRKRVTLGPLGATPVPDYPYRAFETDFLFPLNDRPLETAAALFRLAIEILGAEYGYYFVRDELCGPWLYAHGFGSNLGPGKFCYEESEEVGRWAKFVGEGRLWTGKWPIFRDLFEANLLSSWHMSTPIEGLGFLHEWVSAEPGRGRLEDLGQGRFLWTLTSVEICSVRPILDRAGVLFTCRDRVYRDLPHSAVDAQRLYDAQVFPASPRASDARRDYPDRFRG
jgi:hypothetical protein